MGSPSWRRAFILGLLACSFVTVLALALVALQDFTPSTGYLARSFDGRSSTVDRLLVRGDGQAYAAVAADPLLDDPTEFRGGDDEAVYRAQRPLLSWGAWLLAAGQPPYVGPALLAGNVLAGGALVVATTALVRQRGGRAWLGVAIVATPAVFLSLSLATAEVLGFALAMGGVVLWTREPARRSDRALALAFLAGAVLARESFVLVPIAIAAFELVRVRGREAARAAGLLALTPLPYVAWVLFLRARVGAWPVGSQDGRLSPPLLGIFDAAGSWQIADVILFGILVLAIVGAARHRDDVLSWIALAQIPLLLVAGPLVMYRWQDFGRVFGLVYLVGAIVVGSARFPEHRASAAREQTA